MLRVLISLTFMALLMASEIAVGVTVYTCRHTGLSALSCCDAAASCPQPQSSVESTDADSCCQAPPATASCTDKATAVVPTEDCCTVSPLLVDIPKSKADSGSGRLVRRGPPHSPSPPLCSGETVTAQQTPRCAPFFHFSCRPPPQQLHLLLCVLLT